MLIQNAIGLVCERGKVLKGARVLVLGVAYKPDIDDLRESPALDVIALLRQKGAQVGFHDPYIPKVHHETEGWEMSSVSDLMKSVREAEAVVIVTNHTVYDYPAILDQARFVFDSRNALGKLGEGNPKVARL